MTTPIKKSASFILNGHAEDLIEAARHAEGKFISPEQLADKFEVPSTVVRDYLDARPDVVRRADVRDQHGNGLYARANEPTTLLERWGRLYAYLNKEILPSYRHGS